MSPGKISRIIFARIIFDCVLVVLLALGVLLISAYALVFAHTQHGYDPNDATVRWFESKMMPDQPTPCCGKGDAYPVDNFSHNPDGTITAWVADGSAIKFPDGTTRDYYDASVPVIIPQRKINDLADDLDNPTDHGWVFMQPFTSNPPQVYCFIRHPNGS